MSLLQFSEPTGTTVTLKTNMGDMSIMFFPSEAPKCVENFITHCKNGYYNGLLFHRVIKNFMIQSGDPEGTGMGGESIWGHGISDEYSDNLFHFKGAVCMAKSNRPNSIGSQFYIVDGEAVGKKLARDLKKNYPEEVVSKYMEVGGYPFLDKKYTVIGQVFDGINVISKIAGKKTDYNDRPYEDVIIENVEVNEK